MKRDLTAGSIARTAIATALLGLATLPGRAPAQTACGSLITNIATATMWDGAPTFTVYTLSYNVTATVLVLCPPVIALRKSSSVNGDPLIQCSSGCVVTFQVCLENQQFGPNDSVWSVTITDRLPQNMAIAGPATFNYNTTNPSLGADSAYHAFGATPPGSGWTAGLPPTGQTSNPTTTFVRWVVSGIGPTRSACLTYTARIL